MAELDEQSKADALYMNILRMLEGESPTTGVIVLTSAMATVICNCSNDKKAAYHANKAIYERINKYIHERYI